MRSFLRPGTARWRRRGEAELIAVRSRFGELDERCSPGRVHEVHLELLGAFGRSIGFDFFGRTPIEPPEQESTYVFGRFDRRARDREFGLHLTAERSAGSPTMRIARLIDLYLPEPSRRQGAGTRLMDVLLELWERIGIEEVRATTVGDGQWAFPSWGFEPDPVRPPDSGLLPLRLRLPRKALRVDGKHGEAQAGSDVIRVGNFRREVPEIAEDGSRSPTSLGAIPTMSPIMHVWATAPVEPTQEAGSSPGRRL